MRYFFTSEDNSTLAVEYDDGTSVAFSWESGTRAWKEFVLSGLTPEPYVAPPEPKTLTTEEKVNQLLSDYGLTRDEMRTALEVKTSGKTAG